MFTGIIEEIGHIKAVKKQTFSQVLVIEASKVLEGTDIGQFSADVMHETVRRTSLKNIRAGSRVNLERAMSADGRFGGHMVSGHIDGTGTISDIRKDDNAVWYRINADDSILRYVVEKGSITIDGISLTVATVTDKYFEVNLETDIIAKYVEKLLCPYGGSRTVLDNGDYNQSFNNSSNAKSKISNNVNSNVDIKSKNSGITKEFLLENGF